MLLKLVLGFYESAFEVLMREVISIGLTWFYQQNDSIDSHQPSIPWLSPIALHGWKVFWYLPGLLRPQPLPRR